MMQKPAAPVLDPIEVRLRETVEEAPGITSLFFDYPREKFQYRPGQFARLYTSLGPEQPKFHSFSIASSPTEDRLQFTTVARPESLFKQSLWTLQPGAQLFLKGPMGRFTLPEDPSKPLLLLGNGIGITPFRSMAKYASDKQLPHKVTLVYSNTTPEQIIYRKEWDEMQRQNPNLKVIHTIKSPERSGEKWTGRTGPVNEKLIRENTMDPAKTLYYVCGPPAVIGEVTSTIRDMGIDATQVFLESFPGYM